jgi:hypothetical protein
LKIASEPWMLFFVDRLNACGAVEVWDRRNDAALLLQLVQPGGGFVDLETFIVFDGSNEQHVDSETEIDCGRVYDC